MDMKIGGLPLSPTADPSFKIFQEVSAPASESFASYLEKSMNDVNQLLNEADQKSTDLAAGKTENLHESMIAIEKAETAFKMMAQFRAKAIEAYNEIMRMQV